MFSNDRFMTMATGLVLAIAVGTIAQNSDRVMSFITGENLNVSQDDQYTVRAGSTQQLDVLANDKQPGEITIVSYPECGTVRAGAENTLEFTGSAECSGDVAFSYCVPFEGECDERTVALNVINTGPAAAETETKVAEAVIEPTPVESAPAVSTPAVSAPVAAVPVEEKTVEEPATSAPTRVSAGDRLTPGQILVQDDSSEVEVAGFGASSGPSLFAPDMAELIQPQETVAILRRSVAGVAPSRIAQDQNIQTQRSAAISSNVQLAGNTLSDNVTLGTESSPTVSFSSPAQPRLSPSPMMLAPVNTQPQVMDVLGHGPEVQSVPPVQFALTETNDEAVITPGTTSFDASFVVAAAIDADSSSGSLDNVDATPADAGDVMVASGAGVSDVSSSIVVAALSADAGAPTSSNSPTLSVDETSILAGNGPEVKSAAPTGIALEESTIDRLVAAIFHSDSDVATGNSAAGSLESGTSADEVGSQPTQTADAGSVSVRAADPADSSDLVVEMAAQILLPGPQLNDTLTRVIQTTPETEALLSDQIYSANLEVSPPPSADPVEVASIAPVTELPSVVQPVAECDARMSASARPGAGIAVFVSSRCRADQAVTVSHADFSFSARLDSRGTYAATIPGFTTTAVVEIKFEDDTTSTSQVTLRDAGDLERMAIVWSIPVDLDLHAFEGDANDGDKGHVWAENARTYRDTLTGGGGYLETFGDSTVPGGAMAEVYSLPTNRIRRETTVNMDLRINGIGNSCGNNMLLRTVRTTDQNKTTKRDFNLRLPSCETASRGLVIEDFVDAIAVAKR